MKLFEEFKLYESMWDSESLTEAKADTQKLIDFAGEDLANRFLAVKHRLSGQEKDLYYWIKNKSVSDLEQRVDELENRSSNSRLKKYARDGAELLYETEHWKIYYITSYEASQYYGRDTTWCITGARGKGKVHWDYYADHGDKIYFFITKDHYDARGEKSKFALALQPSGKGILFNQEDTIVGAIEMPFYETIYIPGVGSLFEICDVSGYIECFDCDLYEKESNAIELANGRKYCRRCFNKKYIDEYTMCKYCQKFYENNYVLNTAIYDEFVCDECWEDYLESPEGYVDKFVYLAKYDEWENFTNKEAIDEQLINELIKAWNKAKVQDKLDFVETYIAQLEDDFIEHAEEEVGIILNPSVFK